MKRRLGGARRSAAPTSRSSIADSVRRFNGVAGQPRSFDALDDAAERAVVPARALARRVGRDQLPPFLRRQPARGAADGRPGGVRGSAPLRVRAGRRGARRPACASITSMVCSRPGDYLRRLQARCGGDPARGDRFFVVVEKILGAGEQLPTEWPVHGTTGYEFAAVVNNLFVDRRNERAIDDIYRAVHPRAPRAAVVRRPRVSQQETGHARDDVGRHQLARPPAEPLLRAQPAFPRLHAVQPDLDAQGGHRLLPRLSHLRDGEPDPVSEHDRRYIVEAMQKREAPRAGDHPLVVFDFIERLLLKQTPVDDARRVRRRGRGSSASSSRSPARSPRRASRTRRCTCYNRLLSLNEVGADPTQFGLEPAAVHAWMAERQRQWPAALSATSTHDTQARRRCPRAAERAVGNSGRLEGRGREVARAQPPVQDARSAARWRPTRTRSICSTRRSSARGRSTAGRETQTAFRERIART